MDIVKSIGFWSGFGLAMVLALTIGGFLKGYPQFGSLFLISLVIAIFVGFIAQSIAVNRVKDRVRRRVTDIGRDVMRRRRSQ